MPRVNDGGWREGELLEDAPGRVAVGGQVLALVGRPGHVEVEPQSGQGADAIGAASLTLAELAGVQANADIDVVDSGEPGGLGRGALQVDGAVPARPPVLSGPEHQVARRLAGIEQAQPVQGADRGGRGGVGHAATPFSKKNSAFSTSWRAAPAHGWAVTWPTRM